MIPALSMKERDKLALKYWPEGMAFDSEHEELLRRGWPRLRILSDDPKENSKAEALARKHASGLDPILFVHWPRTAATTYLHLFADQNVGNSADPKKATVDSSKPIDVDVLDRVLAQLGKLGYDWLMHDALFLAEAFLGPRLCAERTIAALERLDFSKIDRPASWSIVAIGCLELFVLRADDDALHDEVVERLGAIAKRAGNSLVAARVRLTLEGAKAHPAVKDLLHYNADWLSVDEAHFPKYLSHEYADRLYTPIVARVAGPGLVPAKLADSARRQPVWKQLERCETFECVKHQFVVELFAGMVGSKGAKGKPEAWLAEHLEFARPTLERLVAESHREAAALQAILSCSGAAPIATKRKLTARQVDTLVKKAFVALAQAMKTARGNPAAEREAIRATVHAIVEARAEAGEVLPEAHVGHFLMLDGWGKLAPPLGGKDVTDEELDRWGKMIDEATTS